jgi:hypothetical protein
MKSKIRHVNVDTRTSPPEFPYFSGSVILRDASGAIIDETLKMVEAAEAILQVGCRYGEMLKLT